MEWDCYTALIHLLFIWETSNAVTQFSYNLNGSFKETKIRVGKEENWVQAKFRALRCFKTWNLVGCFRVFGWLGFFWGSECVLDFGVFCLLPCSVLFLIALK